MTLTAALLVLAGIAILGFVGHWIISSFFPDPLRSTALVIFGVLLLVLLISQFFPSVSVYRLWR